jgi:hypothetical protein
VLVKYYIWGVLAMGCLVSALFFLRYWRSSRDRLFAFFATAFGLMAVQWTLSALTGTDELDHSHPLLLRILAFLAIIVGISDKNRRERRQRGA